MFSMQECEAVIFAKFRSACMYVRQLIRYSSYIEYAPHAHACMLCMPNMVSQGFAYNANHIHDVIGIHVPFVPGWNDVA